MKPSAFQQQAQRMFARVVLSAMLLIGLVSTIALGASAGQPVPVQTAQRVETPTPLLPNTPLPIPPPVVATPALPGRPGDAERQLSDPFPTTPGMTETIRLALEDFAARAALAPEGEAGLTSLQPQNIPQPSGVYFPIAVRAVIQPSPTVTPTPQPEPEKLADVAVALWAEPSIRVARGAILTYEIRVRNYGSGAARSTHVTLPFNPGQITPVGSALSEQAGDWVSELTGASLTVTFGEVGARDSRNGWIFFRVANTLATNTVVGVRGSYYWCDAARTRSGFTNLPAVLVGSGNDTAAYVWTIVDPIVGAAGLKRTFFSDRFLPKEGITAWLNTPTGVRALDVRGVADSFGRVWLEYTPSALAPATYQMVLYGNRSQLTGVVSFVVR